METESSDISTSSCQGTKLLDENSTEFQNPLIQVLDQNVENKKQTV